MTFVHIHRTALHAEVLRKPDGEERWCFHCRKKQRFEYVVESPTDVSYYGPIRRIECSACKTWDGDCFPGTQREWGDD